MFSNNNRPVYLGSKQPEIVVILDYPDPIEAELGKILVGKQRALFRHFESLFPQKAEVAVIYGVNCVPVTQQSKGALALRKPTPKEVTTCSKNNLAMMLKCFLVNTVVITFGNYATKAYKETGCTITNIECASLESMLLTGGVDSVAFKRAQLKIKKHFNG